MVQDDDLGSEAPPQGNLMKADSVCVQRHTVRVASLMTGYAVEGQVNDAGRPPDAREILRMTPACICCSAPASIIAATLNNLQVMTHSGHLWASVLAANKAVASRSLPESCVCKLCCGVSDAACSGY